MKLSRLLALLAFTSGSGVVSLTSTAKVTHGSWQRRVGEQKQRIHYVSSFSQDNPITSSPPIILLNGFGVGLFHWERNVIPLSEMTGSAVFAMDYVGQGDSWPVDCNDGDAPSEKGLRYSLDEWLQQTIEFVLEVVVPTNNRTASSAGLTPISKCVICGNSLGGLLATLLAVRRPDLVDSIVLLNPTPVWGSGPLPLWPWWDARLPAPPLPRKVGRLLYDTIRDRDNINDLLTRTYANSDMIGDLPEKIRGVTDASKGGHAAFASILWSPPVTKRFSEDGRSIEGSGKMDFYELIGQVECDVLLLYGREDPWCSPAFGRRTMRALQERKPVRATSSFPRQTYCELSPCGHCPHHEAPEATNAIITRWCRERAKTKESEDATRVVRGEGCEDDDDDAKDAGTQWLFSLSESESFGPHGVVPVEVLDASSQSVWETILSAVVR